MARSNSAVSITSSKGAVTDESNVHTETVLVDTPALFSATEDVLSVLSDGCRQVVQLMPSDPFTLADDTLYSRLQASRDFSNLCADRIFIPVGILTADSNFPPTADEDIERSSLFGELGVKPASIQAEDDDAWELEQQWARDIQAGHVSLQNLRSTVETTQVAVDLITHESDGFGDPTAPEWLSQQAVKALAPFHAEWVRQSAALYGSIHALRKTIEARELCEIRVAEARMQRRLSAASGLHGLLMTMWQDAASEVEEAAMTYSGGGEETG